MNIKELRTKLDLTQEQLAQKLKVSTVTVNRWENGTGNPSSLTKNLKEYTYLQYIAIMAVNRAVTRGELAKANTLPCADCGRSATCYDHRDYFAPLTVDPVCRPCNHKRGPAFSTVEKILVSDEPIIPEGMEDLGAIINNTITIRIPPELAVKLEQIARSDRRSVNNLIVLALDQWLDNFLAPPRSETRAE